MRANRISVLFFVAILTAGLRPPLATAAEPKDFAALQYRLVGPFAGGRVSRACGVPGDPLTYYAATASGGVWKSTDAGHTWKPIFDDQPTSSIGSIAVAPSDPNVVYVGTGEANIRGNVAPGAGIFKSDDGGKTWKHVWKQIGQIGTMAVHPTNADIAFAAVLGHAFGPNSERGIYRTTNGGKTWKRVLFKNDETGASDVCIDSNNPRVIFAGFWQARRRPWEMTSGGPGSDLYVSRDGGDSWMSLASGGRKSPVEDNQGANVGIQQGANVGIQQGADIGIQQGVNVGIQQGADAPRSPKNGLPPKPWGKIGVAIAPANSQRVYALIEAEKGGLYRSDDGGENWTLANESRQVRQRAWYYGMLTVHPTNPDVVFAPNVPLLKTIDAGKTFTRTPGLHHGDTHDLWIDPKNPNRMICSNDGGVDISTDGGKSWAAPPLPISQCYHVSTDTRTPYRVMACLQDLGSASGPSHSLKFGGIGAGDWYDVGGGEAGFAFADPSDPDIVYAGEYGGIMTRYDHRTGQARNITVNQYNPSGIDPAKMKYRFQWTAPILISQHDPKTVYHGANVLFRTRDGGHTWDKVSGDLTRNDKQKQQWSGGPITGDNTGAEVYCTIFAIAESPKQKGVLWTGSDDGLVHVSKDEGKTWQNVTANIPGMPDWGTVACIEASPHDAGTAYLVVRNHRMNDYKPYVWKTSNFGQSWTAISEGLDERTFCHAIREDGKKRGLLYLGSEHGVMYSPDAGKTWKSLQQNLPTVPVHDLVVKGDDLVVGTHGRSIWILDDLTPLRQTTDAIRNQTAHLFPVHPATNWRLTSGAATTSFARGSNGQNPPAGAAIWFQLAKDFKGETKLEILDEKGTVIAKASGKFGDKPGAEPKEEDDSAPKPRKMEPKPGLNRFVWDLTHDGATPIPGATVDSGGAAARIPVAPGTYTARLKVGLMTSTQDIEVKCDPRWQIGQTALTLEVPEPKPMLSGPGWLAVAINSKGEKKPFSPGGLWGLPLSPGTYRLVQTNGASRLSTTSLADQEKLSLRVRDDITRLSDTVSRLRAIKKQIALRKELLKGRDDAKDLLKQSEALDKKLNGLEDKLHNPKAKIPYDIFAYRGGAMLYSQFAWLLSNMIQADGAPTKAQQELADDLEKQLAGLVSQFEGVAKADVGKLNEAAKKLGVPELYVPPAKKTEPKK